MKDIVGRPRLKLMRLRLSGSGWPREQKGVQGSGHLLIYIVMDSSVSHFLSTHVLSLLT